MTTAPLPGDAGLAALEDDLPAADVATLVRSLHASLAAQQRDEICFDWDHVDGARGLLRSFVANHWQVTRPCVSSDFFTSEQRHLIQEVFKGLLDPGWLARFLKMLRDDTKGHPWGTNQSIALFEDAAGGRLQMVFCGRHLTLRANAHRDEGMAFGGPIFYAHAVRGFFERPRHPGNVFWCQAVEAGRLYDALDAGQREAAEVDRLPQESAIGFRSERPGVAASTVNAAQRESLGRLVGALIEPFRAEDRACVLACIEKQGGLSALHMIYSRDGRMSAPLWDNWRLEGPSLVWNFRGFPHVHVMVHVADHADVVANAHQGTYIFPGHDPLR